MHRRLNCEISSFIINYKKDCFHIDSNIRYLVTKCNNNNIHNKDHENNVNNNNVDNVNRIIKQRRNPTNNQIISYHFKLQDIPNNINHHPHHHNQHHYYKIEKIISNNISLYHYIYQFHSKLWSYLLPKGYPYSIRDGYSNFIQYQMLSNILSTAGGVLSMQSLLYAIGK